MPVKIKGAKCNTPVPKKQLHFPAVEANDETEDQRGQFPNTASEQVKCALMVLDCKGSFTKQAMFGPAQLFAI